MANSRYGSVTQAFHWFTAILVLIAFIYAPGGSEQRIYAPETDFARQLHETLGLSVLTLTAIRLLWRLVDTHPEPPKIARWMGVASKAVQGLLYVLLLAVPLTAVFGAWLEGHSLTLLAGMNIRSPIGVFRQTGELVAEIHTWLGDAILWVAGAHALAGLYHHYFLKDGVLVSMLPRWIPLHAPENASSRPRPTTEDI